jgi:uncharacterized protein YPO0396
VPEDLYREVADWVDRTHLKGRLVFYKTSSAVENRIYETGKNSLLGKLDIKADHPLLNWLEGELSKRFDYTCCDTMEVFRKVRKGLTRMGLMKSGGSRHEKDDRHMIDDRSRYVL